MKSMTAIAAVIGIACAASASNTFAGSGAPGSTPPKPNSVRAVPPPPPPGGPDKLITRTQPTLPGDVRTRQVPKVADDFAAKPRPGAKVKTYKCYSNCNIFVAMCEDMGGGASTTPDGGVLCTVYD